MEKISKKEFFGTKTIAEKLNADYNNGEISFDDAFDKLYTAFHNDEDMKILDNDFGVMLDDEYEEEDGEYCITIWGNGSLTDYEKEGLRNTQLVKELEKMELADDFIDNFDSYLTSNMSNVVANYLVEKPVHWYGYDEDIEDTEDPILDAFNNMVEWFNATVEEREDGLEEEVKYFIKEMFELTSKEIEYRG